MVSGQTSTVIPTSRAFRVRAYYMGSWGLSVHEGAAHVLYPLASHMRLGYRTPMDTEHGQVPHASINTNCPLLTTPAKIDNSKLNLLDWTVFGKTAILIPIAC